MNKITNKNYIKNMSYFRNDEDKYVYDLDLCDEEKLLPKFAKKFVPWEKANKLSRIYRKITSDFFEVAQGQESEPLIFSAENLVKNGRKNIRGRIGWYYRRIKRQDLSVLVEMLKNLEYLRNYRKKIGMKGKGTKDQKKYEEIDRDICEIDENFDSITGANPFRLFPALIRFIWNFNSFIDSDAYDSITEHTEKFNIQLYIFAVQFRIEELKLKN